MVYEYKSFYVIQSPLRFVCVVHPNIPHVNRIKVHCSKWISSRLDYIAYSRNSRFCSHCFLLWMSHRGLSIDEELICNYKYSKLTSKLFWYFHSVLYFRDSLDLHLASWSALFPCICLHKLRNPVEPFVCTMHISDILNGTWGRNKRWTIIT